MKCKECGVEVTEEQAKEIAFSFEGETEGLCWTCAEEALAEDCEDYPVEMWEDE